jgi:parallel beta-helix repeat protein
MRSKRFALPVAFMVVATAVLLIGVSAQGGTQTTAVACGATITGSVTLAANTDCSGTAATSITIGADGVTINLNGHTLTGNASNDCIYSDGYNNVTVIGPGKLTGCTYGVYAEYGGNFTTKNLTVDTPGSEGVYYEYMTGSRVIGVTVKNAVSEGIDLEYGASNVVSGNTVSNSTGNPYQLYVYYENESSFSNNVLSFSTQNSSASAYNIWSDEGMYNSYTGNTMTNGYYGLYLDCDDYGAATISNNTVTSPYEYGMYIEDCYDDNAYYASGATSPLIVSGNTVTGSATEYGFYDYYNPGAQYTNNVAKNNYYGGFYFGDEEPQYVITGNTSNGATSGDGFYFEYTGEGYGPKTVSKNVAAHNSDWGYEANYHYYGVPGSSNSANSNGSGSCYLVAGC